MRVMWPRNTFMQYNHRFYVETGYVVEDVPNYNYYVLQK